MKDSFTLNDLILYSKSIGSENEDEMESRRTQSIGECPIGPDKRIISNILNYSRALSVMKTKQGGSFNLLLN